MVVDELELMVLEAVVGRLEFEDTGSLLGVVEVNSLLSVMESSWLVRVGGG